MGVTQGEGSPCLLAMDAGNSKTDVAVVTTDGTVLARERGPGFAPIRDQARKDLVERLQFRVILRETISSKRGSHLTQLSTP